MKAGDSAMPVTSSVIAGSTATPIFVPTLPSAVSIVPKPTLKSSAALTFSSDHWIPSFSP